MTDAQRMHMSYVIFMLSVVILVLVAVEWATIPNLAEIITFGLTVTSLVLAVLAIVYAYVSNASNADTISRLSTAAADVVRSADEVREATARLGQSVETLPVMISDVGERIDRASTAFKEATTQQTLPMPADAKAPRSAEDHAKRFLSVASISGSMLLLACKKAVTTKKPMSLHDLSTKADLGDVQYLFGFLVASSGAGIVDWDGKIDAITVKALDEHISNNIEARLHLKLESKRPALRDRMFANMGKVAALFQDTPIAIQAGAGEPPQPAA